MMRVAETMRENVVRTSTRTFVTACALAAALLVDGCGGSGGEEPAPTTAPRSVTDVTLDHSALPGESETDTTSISDTKGTTDSSSTKGTTNTTDTTATDEPTTGDPASLSDEIGPARVPERPDLPDGGGLIPDDTDETVDLNTTGSIFDSPTDLFVD